MWMKYRHRFAEGTRRSFDEDECDWYDFGEIPPGKMDEYVEEKVGELHGEFDYSEHYRGLEYELWSVPPLAILEEHRDGAFRAAANWNARAGRLQRLTTKVSEGSVQPELLQERVRG